MQVKVKGTCSSLRCFLDWLRLGGEGTGGVDLVVVALEL